jgi:hypothetical protein
MKQITTSKATIVLVELPEGAINPFLIDYDGIDNLTPNMLEVIDV